MGWCNYDDARRQLEAIGLLLDEGMQVGPSKSAGGAWRVRVRDEGRERRGWYRLHEITLRSGERAIVGSFGVFRGDTAEVHKVQLGREARDSLDAEQRAAIKARLAEDRRRYEAERAAAAARAARRAARWWAQCRDEGVTEYIAKKGLASRHGARISPDGNLVVPMHDEQRAIRGLQVIYSDPKVREKKGRDKDYAPPGLAKLGAFFTIGSLASGGGIALLCEGFATGASLHEATSLPVIVCFDAGNLLPVAQALQKQHRRRLHMLFCADDDYLGTCLACKQWTPVAAPACERCGAPHGKTNTGVARAEAAALAVDGAWVAPEFPAQRPTNHKGPTDFNDLHVHPQGGLQMVAAQVETRLSALGWRANGKARADSSATGGGERKRAEAIISLDDAVDRFIPLDDGTGDLVFDAWTNRVVKRAQMLVLLPAGVRGDDIKRHPTWIERGSYYLDQVGFDPGGTDRNVRLNTWKGWPMAPARGNCELMLETLRYLCGQDARGAEVFDWLLRWMAYPLQHPGAKMASAVIMHGPQGTGKSTIFKALAKIYGDGDSYRNYAVILDQKALQSDFNSDWDSKLFVLAEEVINSSDKWQLRNELKELVTGDRIRINRKFVDSYYQTNRCNLAFLSNEHHPLPIDNDDRRHLVVYTPPALSESYYDELYMEIDAGGVAALYDYLLHLDLDGWHPNKRPPMTEAKQRLIDLSAPSERRFLAEWIEGDLAVPVCPCLGQDLYTAYLRWCRRQGEARPRPSNQFFGTLINLRGWAKRKARVYVPGRNDPALKPIVFPPDEALREHDALPPDGDRQTRWLSECIERFGAALQNEAVGSAL